MSLKIKSSTTRTRIRRSAADKARTIVLIEGGTKPVEAFGQVFGDTVSESMKDTKRVGAVVHSFRTSINNILSKGGDTAAEVRSILEDGGVALEETTDADSDTTDSTDQ